MKDLFVQFQGFHPSHFTQSYLNGTLAKLQKAAPAGSTLDAIFSRRDKVFKATVAIHSSVGEFFATASGHRVKEVIRKLMGQLRRQIKKKKSLLRGNYDKGVMG